MSRIFAARKLLLSTFLALMICSCASDVANRYYLKDTYPPKPPFEVELLSHNPEREFIVMADFQARGETPEGMRKRAAEIGADAVIVQILGGNYSRSDEWVGKDSMSTTYSRITATAIKYK